jgi:hypothetical protein
MLVLFSYFVMIFIFRLLTDGLVTEVLRGFLGKYGKQWDGREVHKIVGKTPFEAAAAIVEDYELPCTTSEFMSEINPIFSEK